MRRVAIVGSGISGLAVAHRLAGTAQITLFEAADWFGGHTHTVDLTIDGVTHGVDTGFLVFNHRTYPNLVRLFETLGVETAASDMSFSVKSAASDLEWSGSDLNGVFAQRRNLLRPRFLGMLREVMRMLIPERLLPALHTSSFNAGQALPAAVRPGWCAPGRSRYQHQSRQTSNTNRMRPSR